MPENGDNSPRPENAGGATAPAKLTLKSTGTLSRIRRIPPEVPIFLLFLVISVFLTWPVARHFTRTVYGIPSDNLGTMWGWWWLRNASSFNGSATFSPLIGYPFGQGFASVPLEPIFEYGARLMLLFATQTVVYNLIITSSFFLSGITMYYLVRHLTHDRRAAFFGGFAYLVSVYHAYHSMQIATLAITQWMPLYILTLLLFIKKASFRNAIFVLLSALLVAETSIHYGLFMLVFTPSFLLGGFAYKKLHARRLLKTLALEKTPSIAINRKTLALSMLIILVFLTIVSSFAFSNLSSSQGVGKWQTRPSRGYMRNLEASAAGSASPLAYVLPEKENFFLGWITRRFATNRVNVYDNSLFLGLSVIALAVFAIFLILRRSRRKRIDTTSLIDRVCADPDQPNGRTSYQISEESKWVAWGLVGAAAVAFICSMPPYMHIKSARIPLPSILLRYLAPWLRWYMRFGIVVIICFILLASFGLSWLLRKMGKFASWLTLCLIVVFLFLEMIVVPPFNYFKVGPPLPKVFQRVASMKSTGGLVIYPAFEPGFFNVQQYQSYQQTFQKPMLNGGWDNSDGEALRRTVYNPFNPATPGILKRFGIDHVVYLGTMFEKYEGTEKSEKEVGFLPPGLELEYREPDKDMFGDGNIYRVNAPAADLVPIYQGDITVPIIDSGRLTVRLVERDGIIRIVNYAGKEVLTNIDIPISNLAFNHLVTVSAEGKVYWRGRISGDQAKTIEIRDLAVPSKGLEMRLSVEGTGLIIPSGEAYLFGTDHATLRLGDVSLKRL